MFINISDSKEAANKGSSGVLVQYLEKENRLNKKSEPEYWFNGQQIKVDPYEVMKTLDGNIAKLGKADAKFFLVNISPSQKEIAFLKEQYGEEGAKAQLKGFAVRVMDAYAQNFKRDGIKSHEDLVWFAKLENHRYYTHKEPEVKQGIKKRGDRKEGEQMHVQVIVSRKDRTNSIKLSPMNTSRGKNEEHSKKMGQFDRLAFKQSGESFFDELFEFDRGLKETMAYANTKKNGSLEDRIKMETLETETAEPHALNERENTLGHHQSTPLASLFDYAGPIGISIADDVDDEAVYGKNRHRNKSRGR
ncbi:MAG: DUF5712 family protein [Bacteroidota bacterium]|uniref:DUF5712 family protein n=1 Tax=Mucilaginibacter sp. MD40 TaxID=2029590 RepID=UPI000BAC99C2|nr:DUF5712 family protein [Mucilaginibacter sp. MD40]PAW92711.1 molybdopterin-guanine dinucleotide biosynthesis protein MobB [Mucilaginibacter sp. MD40]